MDSARWERIQALFHAATERPASEWTAFLSAASGGDRALMADVLAMLEEDARGSSLLDRDVAQVAGQMMGQAAAPAMERFGPYRLRQLLGEGGMGVVYLAQREDLGSYVAIKILRDAWMSPARRARFAGEQRTLAQLTHPSIARLYDADTLADGTPWFAMEYVEGLPLTDYCRRHKSSVEDRLGLIRAVSEAVQYAHSHAVIHRDLKPSNILVQADGAVKLLDFGIAKQLDEQDAPADVTRAGLRLLTPAYSAPEQLSGGQVGVYTDVYSLGVLLQELLTEAPQPDPVGQAFSLRRALARPSSGNDACTTLPADLEVLCQTARHPAPERRYRSVEALIRDIDHYLAGEPLDARPDSLVYRTRKFLGRNRQAVTAAALVLVSIAGLTLYYTVRLRWARNAAQAEAARTQRVLRFTLDLFNGGDKEAGPASGLRVSTLIDRGVAEAGSLEREPAVQAELYETLGAVYQKLGELDRADALLNSALLKRRSLPGAGAEIAETQVKLGLLRIDQARLEDAERLVREGLTASKRTLPAGDPGIATATHALGRVLEERGKYPAAIGVLQEAVRLRSAPGVEPAALADSLLELANSHFYAGHYTESAALNQRLLVMHRQLYGERHPLLAEDLINLGAIQQELGHYPEAEAFHRRALKINEAFYGADHYKTASNLTLIARALAKQNRVDEALQLLQRAIAIQEKVFGTVHPRVASAVNELGTVALARDRFDEAEAAFRRMASIYRSVYSGKHYLVGIALANLGSVYMARHQNARAEQLYRDALAMYAQTLPPGNLNEAITRIKLGRALLRQKHFQNAEPETRAGYQILSKQASPSVTWLRQARADLASEYTALQQPEKAREFQAEAALKIPATAKTP